MLIAGISALTFVTLVIVVFALYAKRLPAGVLALLGKFLVVVSFTECVFIVWVLGYVWTSHWTLWSLSFDTFWIEQLSAIYFIKQWLYTWLWNDFLDFFFVFLPAIVFLVFRTTLTTVLAIWSLALARQAS